MNKASLDRGFGRCTVFKKYLVPLKKFPNGTSEMAMPPPKAQPPVKGAGGRARATSFQAQYKVRLRLASACRRPFRARSAPCTRVRAVASLAQIGCMHPAR